MEFENPDGIPLRDCFRVLLFFEGCPVCEQTEMRYDTGRARVLVYSADLPARGRSALTPGAEIRITAPSVFERQIVGPLISLDADTLVVKSLLEFSPLSIPLDAVKRLEIKRRKSAFPSVVKGAGIGFLGGGVLGHLYDRAGHPGLPHIDPEVPPLFEYTPFLIMAGTVVGAVIWVGRRGHRWERVPLPLRVGIHSPAYSGPRLSASFAF